jgi:outer membrane lipase/esterase
MALSSLSLRARVLLGAVIAAAVAADAASAAPMFDRIYSLGDSLSDTGNFFLATGQPPPPYNQRFSNGPVWIEQLAGKVGAQPVFPSLAGGTGLAWGFARATDAELPTPLTFSLETQVQQFVNSGHIPTSTELYTVWAGANDLFDGRPNPSLAANAVVNQVARLTSAQVGVKNILVMNLPPIQNTPDFLALTAQERAGAAMWVAGYNALLSAGLDALEPLLATDTNLYRFDTAGFFNELLSDPGAFGLTNVTDRAFSTSPFPSLAPNPDQYLFWDGVHPTVVGHGLLATRVLTVVPEPASGIAAIGLSALLFTRRRRAA